MSGYMAHFMVYTLAMTGLICFAVFVYKKITDGTMRRSDNKFLSIEDSMSISPRKTLHVVRAGNEKFLIASDIDRTALIAKLGTGHIDEDLPVKSDFKEILLNDLNTSIPSSKEPLQKVQPENNRVVHLETVNPARRRKSGERRSFPQSAVEYGNTVYNKNISPMREMAKRINEL